jgi:hypothetical protein
MKSGFYKASNGKLLHGGNFVVSRDFVLRRDGVNLPVSPAGRLAVTVDKSERAKELRGGGLDYFTRVNAEQDKSRGEYVIDLEASDPTTKTAAFNEEIADGWHWFNSEEDALAFFGDLIEPEDEHEPRASEDVE